MELAFCFRVCFSLFFLVYLCCLPFFLKSSTNNSNLAKTREFHSNPVCPDSVLNFELEDTRGNFSLLGVRAEICTFKLSGWWGQLPNDTHAVVLLLVISEVQPRPLPCDHAKRHALACLWYSVATVALHWAPQQWMTWACKEKSRPTNQCADPRARTDTHTHRHTHTHRWHLKDLWLLPANVVLTRKVLLGQLCFCNSKVSPTLARSTLWEPPFARSCWKDCFAFRLWLRTLGSRVFVLIGPLHRPYALWSILFHVVVAWYPSFMFFASSLQLC